MTTKIVQITARSGPVECCHVVAQVLKIFLKECKQKHIQHSILNRVEGPKARTIQSVVLLLKGKSLDSFIAEWVGTIIWKSTSPFRTEHKSKNWYIGFMILERSSNNEILDIDIRYTTMRSQGPGGQHVNKVNSAVRATYIKTGLSVSVMDTRSQHENKKIAKKRLIEKIQSEYLNHLKNEIQLEWKNHSEVERGNPIRVFRGNDFSHKKQKVKYRYGRKKSKDTLRSEMKHMRD